jgi:hypothetical protein
MYSYDAPLTTSTTEEYAFTVLNLYFWQHCKILHAFNKSAHVFADLLDGARENK